MSGLYWTVKRVCNVFITLYFNVSCVLIGFISTPCSLPVSQFISEPKPRLEFSYLIGWLIRNRSKRMQIMQIHAN